MEFHEILKNLRIASEKKAIEVVKDTGISKDSMSNYETGKYEPSIENLIKLANYYEVSVDYLIGNEFDGICLTQEEYNNIQNTSKSLDDMYKILKEMEKEIQLANEEKEDEI